MILKWLLKVAVRSGTRRNSTNRRDNDTEFFHCKLGPSSSVQLSQWHRRNVVDDETNNRGSSLECEAELVASSIQSRLDEKYTGIAVVV